MTLYQEFRNSAQIHKKRPCLAAKINNRWQYIKYKEVLRRIDNVAEGLFRLGVVKDDKVAILSENRPEWLISDMAVNKLGAVIVPIHATSTKPLIEFILNDSDSGFFVVSQNYYDQHKSYIKSLAIKVIVIGFKHSRFSFSDLLAEKPKKTIYRQAEDSVDTDNDIASIIYTSGTTGEPKGVMLTNKNFLANIKAVAEAVPVFPKDKLLSFLPLSHVLERTVGSYIPLMQGASIYYAESIKKLSDNLKEVRPTIIVAVPKIFERVYEKIFATFKEKNWLARKIFYSSLRAKPGSFMKKVADLLIFRKIRKNLGGKIRFAVSGGAGINEKILRFFRTIGVAVTEGYGLTETSPVVASNRLPAIKIGTVGQPVSGVAVKIAPDKEILIKGDSVMNGYYHKDELTREAFTEDGWFRTGDQGYLDSQNYLTIIGRKKDMIVTTNGKNIAPEKLENILNLSPFIEQSLVVGHKREYLSVLIVPNNKLFRKNFKNFDLTAHDKIKKTIAKEIDKINQSLEHHEKIKKFRLIDEPFTVENQELTPTLKIRRRIIAARRQDLIDEIYNEN